MVHGTIPNGVAMKQRTRNNPFPVERPKAPPMFKTRAGTSDHPHMDALPKKGRKVEADHAASDKSGRKHLKHYGRKP